MLAVACGSATSSGQVSISQADQLFQAGRFAQADRAYQEILSSQPRNVRALTRRGAIALLSNRLGQARDLLQQSLGFQPANRQAQQLLAFALSRADDVAHAATLYARLGAAPMAGLLASFAGRAPYDTHGPDGSRIPFLETDSLPLVEASVNGLPPVPFVLDTGATLGVGPGLAQRAGLPQFGGMQAGFAGGTQGTVQLARADELILGDFQIRNLPLGVNGGLGLNRRAPDGRPVEGIIGMDVMSRFISTLDHPGAALVLRRTSMLRQVEQETRASSAVVIQFWMTNQQHLVAWGSVNGHGPLLFSIDTGSAGGFGGSTSTLEAAGVRIDYGKPRRAVGGGGAFTVYPFQVDDVKLGGVDRRNLMGVTNGAQRASQDFTIGGLVGHPFFRPGALTIDVTGMRLFYG